MTDDKRDQAGESVSALWQRLPKTQSEDIHGLGVIYDSENPLRCKHISPAFKRFSRLCMTCAIGALSDQVRDLSRKGYDLTGDERAQLNNLRTLTNELRAKADRITRGTVWARELAEAFGLDSYSPLTDSREHKHRSDKSDCNSMRPGVLTVSHDDRRTADDACLGCLDTDSYESALAIRTAEETTRREALEQQRRADAEAKRLADEAKAKSDRERKAKEDSERRERLARLAQEQADKERERNRIKTAKWRAEKSEKSRAVADAGETMNRPERRICTRCKRIEVRDPKYKTCSKCRKQKRSANGKVKTALNKRGTMQRRRNVVGSVKRREIDHKARQIERASESIKSKRQRAATLGLETYIGRCGKHGKTLFSTIGGRCNNCYQQPTGGRNNPPH